MRFRCSMVLLIYVSLLFFWGCTQENGDSEDVLPTQLMPVQAPVEIPKILLQDSLSLESVEVSGEALGVWRKYSERQPTLLLLSNDPLLVKVPEQLWPQASRTIAVTDAVALSREFSPESSNPLLLPQMTLDAALRSNWFGDVVWAVPIKDLTQGIDLKNLAGQLLATQQVSVDEVELWQEKGKHIQGTVRNTPITIGALSHIPALAGPVVVHIDQSYFQTLYKNEVATPLLSIVVQTLKELRARQVPVLAVTFVCGNLSERIALNVRFLDQIIAAYFKHPDYLDQALPKNWQRQSDILYLENFFKKEMIKELALAMAEEEPTAAWVKFTLYRAAAANRQGEEALDFLSQAVLLDPVYALEYLSLSKLAYDKKLPEEAMRMLTLAVKARPDNPFIKLNAARLALEQKDTDTALHLVEQLQQLEWSEAYYPDMPAYLDGFAAFLKGEQTAPAKPAVDPRRQRILK